MDDLQCSSCGKRAEAYVNGRLACQECIVDFGEAALKANAPLLIAVKGEPRGMVLPMAKLPSNRI